MGQKEPMPPGFVPEYMAWLNGEDNLSNAFKKYLKQHLELTRPAKIMDGKK